MTEQTTTEKPKKEPKRGVGTVIKEALLAGKSNEEALAAAKAEFPASKTNAATVSWYRGQLRKDGHEVPTAREVKKTEPAAPAAEGEAEVDPLG